MGFLDKVLGKKEEDPFEVIKSKELTLEEIEKWTKEHPDGRIYRNVKNPEEAKLRTLALLSSMHEKYEDALNYSDNGLEINPESDYLHYIKGRTLGDIGKVDSGIEELNRAIELRPDFEDAFVERGHIKQKTKDFFGADEDYWTAKEISSSVVLPRGYKTTIEELKESFDTTTFHEYAQAIETEEKIAFEHMIRIALLARERWGIYEGFITMYPKLFKTNEFYYDDPSVLFSFHDVRISCPPGWYFLISKMLKKLDSCLSDKPKEFQNSYKIDRIKQKWGERLEIYTDFENDDDNSEDYSACWDEINKIIEETKNGVLKTCAHCSKEANLKGYHENPDYIVRLCEECGGDLQPVE